jgi:hypothetical protein
MRWLGIAFSVIVVVLIAYRVAFPSVTVRYRLTLEASVDGEPKIGSGVVEVTYSNILKLWATSDLSIDVRGEAVALDLGTRGTLFALLKGNDDYWQGADGIVPYSFGLGGFPRPTPEGITKVRRLSGKVDLPLMRLPLLVRFRDPSDPQSVKRVDPLDIAANFGAGAKLERASVEVVPSGIWPLNRLGITGEPITERIDDRLVWLTSIQGTYLNGKHTNAGGTLSDILLGTDFKGG